MGKRIVKGYWDCEYCGTKHIDGLMDECPNCGAKKRKDIKYYMMEGHVEYVTPDELKKAGISTDECDGNHEDWVCNYCDTLNNFSDTTCSSCGSPRSEASHEYGMKEIDDVSKKLFQKFDEYSESNHKTLDSLKEIVDFLPKEYDETDEERKERMILTELSNTHFYKWDIAGLKKKYNLSDKELQYYLEKIGCDEFQMNMIFGGTKNKYSEKENSPKRSINRKKLFSVLGIGGLVFSLFAGIFYLFKPYEITTEVVDYKWVSTVTVEEERTVKDSDWSVPYGGRVYDEKKEIKEYVSVIDHYETVEEQKSRQVIDHYETKTVQKSRQVIDHYETHSSYSDNGNGTFTENTYKIPVYKTEYYTETYQEPVYKTEYYTETHQEPVYRQDPVYKTKYYYEIDKWFVEDSYKEEAHDKSPYYSDDYTLLERQRDSLKNTSYYVYYDNDMEENVSLEEYLEADIGDQVVIKTCKLGIIYESTEIDARGK